MNHFGSPFARRALLTALALLACGLDGCGSAGPKTYPVKGTVVFKGKGGTVDRLVGGRVWFRSTSDLGLMPEGVIDEDGSFAMSTFYQKKALTGVPAGQYQARVEPPRDGDGKPTRGLIHPKYEDFDKSGFSFTVPTSGEITVEVERPGR
jgi:hypothetical protein